MFAKSKFLDVNRESNSVDYLHGCLKFGEVHQDFLYEFVRFLCPEFLTYKGKVYLKETFSEAKYEKLKSSGKTDYEAQYWLNLIELTSVFENYNFEFVISIGREIESNWQRLLDTNFSDFGTKVKLLVNEKDFEVFVTLEQT
jgi:hypothetical protein